MRIPHVATTPCHPPEVSTVPSHAPARGGAPAWDDLSPIGRLEGLPPDARKRVHRENVRTRWEDVKRYEAYLERYLEGARRCRTPDELRAYGPPVFAGEGLEPDGTDAERLEFARGPSWALRSRLLHANRDLGDIVLRLERRPVPLDGFFDLSLTARVTVGGTSFGGSASARGGPALEAGSGVVAASAAGNRREVGLEGGSLLVVSFDGETGLEAFVARAREESGFVAPLPVALELFAKLRMRVDCAGETRGELEAEVAQVFSDGAGGFRTAFLLDPEALEVRPARSGGGGEVEGASPIFQIKKMNVSQKAQLAMRAGRSERQILLRDSSAQVLQGLLVNPRVEGKEVLQIVKSTHANGALLQRVAADARWGKNPEILATVARNPKTPVPFATRLIDKLRTSDLRVMAKMSSGMRETIRRAALREYLRRTSGR